MSRLLLVTRPAPEAQAWVEQLQSHCLPALALPLIDIRPSTQPAALEQALANIRQSPPAVQALMFVSAAAVTHFFGASGAGPVVAKLLEVQGIRAWATGQGTVRALRQAGVAASQIDAPNAQSAQWDSEALWAQIAPTLGALRQVLIVRGADSQGQLQGRDWLAQQLQAYAIGVQWVAAYERHLPAWTAAQRLQAERDANALWLFTSSEAIQNLQLLLPGHSWATSHALTTHARIAQAAKDAGFAVVYVSRPGLAQIMASIESLP